MGTLLQDVKYGSRILWKNRGFTAVAVIALALGIGANSAIFSVIHGVLLRPLAYPAPDRLVMVWETRPERGIDRNVVGAHEFPEWKAQSRSFSSLAAITYSGAQMTLTGAGDPAALAGARVTGEFFAVMGVHPVVGRTIRPEDDRPGHGNVVVLSHHLWKSRFDANPGIVGTSITLNDSSYAVIGVMPPQFRFPSVSAQLDPPDFWAPIAEPIHLYRGRHYLFVVGRLKQETSLAQAQQEMNTIAGRIAQEYPDASRGHGINVQPLQAELVGDVRTALLVLMGVVGLVLLIACANVANLLLARAAGRRREIAVRSAVGAGRARLVRQLLTESLLLAALGGGLGLLLADWIVALLAVISPMPIPRMEEVAIDPLVLVVTLGLSLLTGIAFGIAPALEASGLRVSESLKEGSRAACGRESNGLRYALVVSEVALALVLLVGAGLLLQSFVRLRSINPGFHPEHVLAAELALSPNRYRESQQQANFYQELFARLKALPGVTAAGGTSYLPLGGSDSSIQFTIEGRPAPPPGEQVQTQLRVVSKDYFRAMSIPLQRGRSFADGDARLAVPLIRWWPQQPLPGRFEEPQPQPVAVINDTMARRFWPGEDPLGRRVQVLFSPWITVVGVVGDVRHRSLGDEAAPELYLFDRQEPQAAMSLLVRTTGDPAQFVAALREQVWGIDPGLPVTKVRALEEVVAESVSGPQFTSFLVTLFAGLAMVLMVVGVYGVVSFSVAQRTHEIGVRMALGAERRDIYRLVIARGMQLALLGVGLGLAGAFALTGFLKNLLFEVSPVEPVTFAVLAVVLLATVFAACWAPARRATRVDPIVALRYE